MAETQMSTVAVIDALLARDLLDWTRSDLNGFRNEAVAGSLSAADEKYVRQLYARIPPIKVPYIPTVRPNYAPYPVEQSWLDGFIGRITLVGVVIFILIVAAVGITTFLVTEGGIINRMWQAALSAGLAALGILLLFALVTWLFMVGLRIIGVALRSIYWLIVGK